MAFLVLFAIHSLLLLVNNIEAIPQEQNEAPKTSSGLYAASDKVTILTANNFNENVYNSTSASVVQFYNSPSDHCIKFAPVYKQLASSVQNWQHIVKVGAIDCADNQNAQLCQQYEIKNHPTIRFFSPLLKTFTTGKDMAKDGSDPASLRAEIINQLAASETKSPNGPNFSAVNSDTAESLQGTNNGDLLILVVERPQSYTGRELIMDLHGVKNVNVRYSSNPKLSNSKDQLPQIFVLKPGYAPKQLSLTNPTRNRVFKLVQSYLMNEGYNVPDIAETQDKNGQNVDGLGSVKLNKAFTVNSQSFSHDGILQKVKLDDNKEAEDALNAYLLIINALATPYQQQLQQQ